MLACAGAILLLSVGTRQGFGLFLRPMSMDLGWGRETFAFAIALQNLIWGLAQPFTGMVADRFGAGRVLVAGGLCYAGGLVLMAFSTTGIVFDAGAGLLVGLGLSASSYGVVLGVVGRSVAPERRSAALGLAGAGGSLGQFAMLPYSHTLIAQFGWFDALLLLAASAFLIVPLGAALAGPPARAEGRQQSMRVALREAGVHPGFWLLTGSLAVCGFQTTFMMIHLPAYLVDRGAPAVSGMTALAVIGFFNIVGSSLAGYLGDIWSKKYLLTGIYAIRAVAIAAFVMLPLSDATIWAFAAAMGLTWLSPIPLSNALVAQIFGVQYLSTLFSVSFLGHQLGAFIGVWFGGYIFDATGSYAVVWTYTFAASVIAGIACLPIDERAASIRTAGKRKA
jgi:MFS family permease